MIDERSEMDIEASLNHLQSAHRGANHERRTEDTGGNRKRLADDGGEELERAA